MFLFLIAIYDENSYANHLIKNNSDINRPRRILDETETLLPKLKHVSWMSSLTKKYPFFLYISFLLVVMALVVVVVNKIQHIHNLEKTLRIKEESSIKNQDVNKTNIKTSIDQHVNGASPQSHEDYLQSISQLNNLLAEKDRIIDQFNKLLLESNHQQNITAKQWTDLLSKKNAAIEKLNQTINESKKQRSTIPLL